MNQRSNSKIEDDWIQSYVQNLQSTFKRIEIIKSFWIKFGSAIVGELLLIVPIWIMTLHKSLVTSLITVSVSVIIFALFVV